MPHDNASTLPGLAPHFALVSEVLDGLHVTDGADPVEFTFERPGGERVTIDLDPISAREYGAAFADPHYGHYPSILPAAPRPLYLASSAKLMWARTLAGGRAVYMGYNVVVSPPDTFLRKITRLVSRPSVRRVIVDVRRNGGGDNTTYGALMTLFETPRVDPAVSTCSSGARRSPRPPTSPRRSTATRATIVGEPTGGGVEAYGDVTAVVLPTTGWNVNVATRYHERRRNPRTGALPSRWTFGSI